MAHGLFDHSPSASLAPPFSPAGRNGRSPEQTFQPPIAGLQDDQTLAVIAALGETNYCIFPSMRTAREVLRYRCLAALPIFGYAKCTLVRVRRDF